MRQSKSPARRFLQAYLEGIRIATSDPALAKQVIGKYTKTSDPGELESVDKLYK